MADDRSIPAVEAIHGGVATPLAHDSAAKHVSGRALYVDDIPEPPGLLHIYIAQSPHPHAAITRLDVSAVRSAPGVADVLTAAEIPGVNDIGAVRADEPLLAEGEVRYAGQPVFAVAADSPERARLAAERAIVEYAPREAIVTLADARKADWLLEEPQVMQRGDVEAAITAAAHRLQGRIAVGGQDHFYLEGQVALALPGEDEDILVHSSTQHPSEVQQLTAKVLSVPAHSVTVEVRRMGGGFGGKETQPAIFAAFAALVARRTGRPAKLRLDRDDDMIITGKRHDFEIDYDVGFDALGRILAADIKLASRCGYAADLSLAVNDRAMLHAENAYFLPAVRITSKRYLTHTASNTAFRGFGGPQGMMGIERVMDAVAQQLGKDPLDVRKANLYGGPGRDLTPYHQCVEDNVAPEIVSALEQQANYHSRRQAVQAFNLENPWLKKGLALTPVKFGISFTTTHLNQAGALIHVYADGSIHLNHGGTEMGQGVNIKVAQVVAEAFQVDIETVKITATSTGKVPNTSATAASSGSDINGMAALNAAETIKGRLVDFAAERYGVARERIRFHANQVYLDNEPMAFADLVRQAYLARVPLSATGFYKTPEIHYDRKTHRGRPFYYFAYGAAVSEVIVDTLTGEYRLERVDILEDVGRSLNPAVDLGQIEGGFIQGMGWLTSEELVFDKAGRLLTHAPSTYKIPTASDRPDAFNITLFSNANREPTIHRSKAVGEPPLMLAISVFSAITDAVASVASHRLLPGLDSPATPEAVLTAIEDLRERMSA